MTSPTSASTNSHPYADILHHERPVSSSHPPLPRTSRAAQFAPFAALSGHDTLIAAAENSTDFSPERRIDTTNLDYNDLEYDHLEPS